MLVRVTRRDPFSQTIELQALGAMKRLPLFALPILLLMASHAGTTIGMTAPRKEAVVYDKGLVTVRDGNIPIMPLLETLSEQAGIHIFLFEPLRGERIRAGIEELPLDQFLSQVLKGRSHAVLYHPSGAARSGGPSPPRMVNPAQPGKAHLAPGGEVDGEITPASAPGEKDAQRDPAGRTLDPDRARTVRILPAPSRASSSQPARKAAVTSPSEGSERSEASSPGVSAYGFNMASSGTDGSPQRASSTQTASGSGGGAASAPSTPTGAGETTTPTPALAKPTPPPPGISSGDIDWTNKDQIQLIVNHLEERIASGRSDRDYEKWASIKGEKYVTHDKETLAYYEQRLAGLP